MTFETLIRLLAELDIDRTKEVVLEVVNPDEKREVFSVVEVEDKIIITYTNRQ